MNGNEVIEWLSSLENNHKKIAQRVITSLCNMFEKEKLSTINDELKCLFTKMQRRLEKEPFYSDDISTVNILMWLATAQITIAELQVIINMWGEEMFITHLPLLFKVNSRLTSHDKVWSLLVSVTPKCDIQGKLKANLKELEEIL